MPPKIPVFKPLVGEEEIQAAREALELGWLGMGSYVQEFEDRLTQFIGGDGRHVVAVSTGYAALHLGLLAAGVGPGDEVITASFNNITDFQAILATGATPVLCDIHDDSLCIDLNKAASLVTSRTKVIIAMDYGCVLCDHEGVAAFARRHNLRVIHDAAHSFGGSFQGRKIGSFSDLTMFSFDPVKCITCIDGGALVVRHKEEMALLHELRLVGMTQPASALYQNERAWTYDVKRVGFRDHLTNLHAAIGLAQLSKIDQIAESRRTVCRYYSDHLSDIPDLRIPHADFKSVVPFLYYVRVPADRRTAFRAYLADHGVDTGFHWQPGHWFTLLKDCPRGDLTTTDRVGQEIVTLPLHSRMAQDTQDLVITAVRAFFAT